MAMRIQRAIVSVSDKTGLPAFVRGLREHGIEMLSTGGTASVLADSNIAATPIAEYTGAAEILGGRVKTLHPRIHGGILARATDEHRSELAECGIQFIDLVVVNLYPFERTIAAPDVSPGHAIENIDIGGSTLIRAAAKNHERVAVVVDPDDYPAILEELDRERGQLTDHTRFALAKKAFSHTAAYDAAIASYLTSLVETPAGSYERRTFPDTLGGQWTRVQDLRYGENPHQSAAFYAETHPVLPGGCRASIAHARVLQGKPLSYNNILDLDAALACVLDMRGPAAVVVKHTNPCGVAESKSGVADAYRRARATDPTSAFGGIVAVNRPVEAALAAMLADTFLECVLAPAFEPDARELLSRKHRLRLVCTGALADGAGGGGAGHDVRSVAGGVLVQSTDATTVRAHDARVVSKRAPTAAELDTLDFAWRVVKHVKSNAIVYCTGTDTATETVGVGAGQMSRVDAARIARDKAEKPLEGTCVASDAFFPFRDGVDQLAAAGATAIIQPGGSIRDKHVIAAADEHGMAMVFTGMRHFRH